MPNSIQDNEKLKQELMQDLASAQAMSKQSSQGRGVEEPSDFAPQAIRVKNRAVAQKELDDSSAAILRAVKAFTSEAGYADEIQAKKHERELTKKFNQYRLYLMRQAGEASKKRAQEEIDADSDMAMMNAITGLVSGSTEALVSRHGRTKPVAASTASGDPQMDDFTSFANSVGGK